MQIKIENLDKLLAQFDVREIRGAAKTAATVTAHEIVNILRVYPPSTSRPGRFSLATHRPMGWYERTRGWWSPVMKKPQGQIGKAFGQIRAKRATGVAGYKLTASSERLREKWTIIQEPGATVVTNAASYAPYVQSATRQSGLMSAIGWGTDADAIKQVISKRVFERAFYQALRARFLKRK